MRIAEAIPCQLSSMIRPPTVVTMHASLHETATVLYMQKAVCVHAKTGRTYSTKEMGLGSEGRASAHMRWLCK